MMPQFPYSFGRTMRQIRAGIYRSSPHRLRREGHPIRSAWLLVRMLVRANLTAVEEWRQLLRDQPYGDKEAAE